jgi:hypothetical protein
MRVLAAIHLLLLLAPAGSSGAQRKPYRTSTTQQRRRFHINPYLTEPGNIDIELGAALSSEYRGAPVNLKYTPDGLGEFGRRTEFSAAFEAVSSSAGGGAWTTHSGDRFAIQASHMLYDAAPFSIVVAPQAAWILRDGEGARLGGTVVANYDFGLNSIGSHVTWSAATASSANNPARDLEAGGGYVRHLGRWTLFASAARETPSRHAHADTLVEGANLQWTRRTALDLAVRHSRIERVIEHQLQIGLTINLGPLH